MPIAAFFVILAGAVAIAILYPHLRVLALAVVALFGTLAVFLFLGAGETGTEHSRIAVEELVLDDVELVQDARFDRLQGRVTNGSDSFRLRDFEVALSLLDCPTEDAARDTCAVVGDEGGIARADVPPGQTRAFDIVLGFNKRPEVKGVLVWDYAVTAVRATE